MKVTFTITETAGLGVNLNFVRFSVWSPVPMVEMERREVGANEIIAASGTNHLNANGTMTLPLQLDFSSWDPWVESNSGVSMEVIFDFTDERGNNFLRTQVGIDNLDWVGPYPVG